MGEIKFVNGETQKKKYVRVHQWSTLIKLSLLFLTLFKKRTRHHRRDEAATTTTIIVIDACRAAAAAATTATAAWATQSNGYNAIGYVAWWPKTIGHSTTTSRHHSRFFGCLTNTSIDGGRCWRFRRTFFVIVTVTSKPTTTTTAPSSSSVHHYSWYYVVAQYIRNKW